MCKKTILFKYTSRSRPERFFKGLESIINNLADKNNYWVQCTFDLSDATMFNPEIISRLNTYKNLSYYFGESKSKIDAINQNLDKLPPFDILVNFSDDQEFIKFGFDEIIREDFESRGGTYGWFIHYPDSHTGDKIPTMSIMDRDYFERSFRIYHPKFISVAADNYAMWEAQQAGRYVFIDKKIYDHFHPLWGMAEWDEQYRKTEDKLLYQKDIATLPELTIQI